MRGSVFAKAVNISLRYYNQIVMSPAPVSFATIILAKEIPSGINLSGFCVRCPFDRNRRGIMKQDIQRVNPIRRQAIEEKQKPWNPRHG